MERSKTVNLGKKYLRSTILINKSNISIEFVNFADLPFLQAIDFKYFEKIEMEWSNSTSAFCG